MKRIFLFVTFSLFLNCDNKTVIFKNDLTRQNLKGKIKNFTESEYTVSDKFGEIKKEHLYYKYNSHLNSNGNLLNENIYDENDPLPIRNRKVDFKYDSKGILVEKRYYKNNNLLLKEIFKYDDLGNMIEKTDFGPDGSLSRKFISKYNVSSYLIEENLYQSDGSLTSKRNLFYDHKNYLTEENEYNADGSLNYRGTYKYDEKGNKIEGNSYNSDGSLTLISLYKYNDEGDIIEEHTSNINVSIDFKFIQKYVYDQKGNWLQVITFKNGIPAKMGIRQYEYY